MAIEKSVKNAEVPLDPEKQLRDVNAAIESQAVSGGAGGSGSKPGSSGDEKVYGSAVLAAVSPGADLLAVVTTESRSTSESKFLKGKAAESKYIGGAASKAAPARKNAMPVQSMSYGDKKHAAAVAAKTGTKKAAVGSGNIVGTATLAESVSITHRSLTGTASTDAAEKKAVPIKGAAITTSTARALGVAEDLLKERDNALEEKRNPFKNTNRLQKELKSGGAAAKDMANRRPDLASLPQPTAPH